MHSSVPSMELIALRAKRAAALARMREAVALGREICSIRKACRTHDTSIGAIEEFIAASSEWRDAYAQAINASQAIAAIRRNVVRSTSGCTPSGAALNLTLRLGGVDYRCALISLDGLHAIEFLCPICDTTFISSRRFTSERDGSFRMLAAIYREHHEPVHQGYTHTDPVY